MHIDLHIQHKLKLDAETIMKQHAWYIELVARSKVIALIGEESTDQQWSKNGLLVREASGWEWITWSGQRLIGWHRPQITMTTCSDGSTTLHLMEYRR